MKTQLSLTIAAMWITSASFSQCSPATAMDTLNINQVSALMLNGGDMWWNPGFTATGQYEVPKGSGSMPIYAGAIWIGGIDLGNQLHLAAQEYRNGGGNDFWPGPLDTISVTTDSTSCSKYNKIWKIGRYKVEEFKYEWNLGNVQNGTYKPDSNIISWPGNGDVSKGQAKYLAPYVDVNHNSIYDPLAGGDYPKIKGDQMLWWIFNDNGNVHSGTQCPPLGVEIHASAYSYTCPQIADSLQVINYTTFYHYEIFNRGGNLYDSVYVASWMDPDLGCGTDDFVGCYPKGNYSYCYNGEKIDPVNCGNGQIGYGLNPPMVSTVILNGPLANPNDGVDNNNNGIIDEPGEKNLMTHFVYFSNHPHQYPRPTICPDYYNYLSGTWEDSTFLTYGGTGYKSSAIKTNFCFPDFPYDTSGWSEVTAGLTPGDRRAVTSCGPFTMLPGAVDTFDFAVVWSRDTALPWLSKASFDKNLHDNQRVQRWFAQDSFPSCLALNVGVHEADQNANNLIISPNPSSDFIFVNYKSKSLHPQFEIYDVMGRKVSGLQFTVFGSQQQINISKLVSGLYLLKVTDGEFQFSKKFVKN
ncbi:MAG: T9SS type A sorting domain-containing protein [Bacteroidia bacterium]